MDRGPGLSVSKHTIWFTTFSVLDSDGQTDAYLRVDYDGDLEMILRGTAYRGRIQDLEPGPAFRTTWDTMDSGSLQRSVHEALQEMPGDQDLDERRAVRPRGWKKRLEDLGYVE